MSDPHHHAVGHVGDIPRDGSFKPKATELRLDLQSLSARLRSLLPSILARHADQIVVFPCRVGLRLWELAVLSIALQIGMLPLLARDFHRVSFIAPIANIPAVLLTGVIVPFGFVSLAISAMWRGLGIIVGHILSFLIGMLAASTHWFALVPSSSIRFPSPPTALLAAFLASALALSAAILMKRKWSGGIASAFVFAGAALIVTYPFPARFERG